MKALRAVADPCGDFANCQVAATQQLFGELQAPLANMFHRRAPGLGEETRMEARHRQTGQACQICHLQRMRCVLFDIAIQGCQHGKPVVSACWRLQARLPSSKAAPWPAMIGSLIGLLANQLSSCPCEGSS